MKLKLHWFPNFEFVIELMSGIVIMDAAGNGQQPKRSEVFGTEQDAVDCSESEEYVAAKAMDRRIQKTLQLLQSALADLIAERDYDEITIKDILDRANVGRSTFYTHFENKDQLLGSILTLLNERFDEGIRQLVEEDKSFVDNSAHMPANVLRFVQQNHDLFKAMLGKPGHGRQANPLYNHLFIVTREHFRLMIRLKHGDPRRLELATTFYATAFIGALMWWLENDMLYSVEEFGQIINQLTLPGLTEAFGT